MSWQKTYVNEEEKGEASVGVVSSSFGIDAYRDLKMGAAVSPMGKFDKGGDNIYWIIKREIRNLAAKTMDHLKDPKLPVRSDFHLVIFIHGFKNNEKEMKKRNESIDDALGTQNVITTYLNWTSKESVLRYKGDQKTVDRMARYFNDYLEEIERHPVFADKQIHIVSHSMGCHLLCKAIGDCPEHKRHVYEHINILCMAPDEQIGYYEKAIAKAKLAKASSWTHFFCKSDLALRCSNVANLTMGRAGTESIDDNEFVDSHEWKPTWVSIRKDPTNHSYMDRILEVPNKLQDVIKRNFKLVQKHKVISFSPQN